VEQNLSVVARLADRIFIMKEGKIIREISRKSEMADTLALESYL
jgi:ABC-type branched-subunit amino acid transport system ATPase component